MLRLTFVSDSLFLLLENPQSLLLDGILARAFAHLRHLILVFAELSVERLDFLLDTFRPCIHLENNNKEFQFLQFSLRIERLALHSRPLCSRRCSVQAPLVFRGQTDDSWYFSGLIRL